MIDSTSPAEMLYIGSIHSPEDGSKYQISTGIQTFGDLAIDTKHIINTLEFANRRLYMFSDILASVLRGKVMMVLINENNEGSIHWFESFEEATNYEPDE